MDTSKTALIIGAGPAGLTAAYELLKTSSIKPVILEKESFVGGISRTVEHNGNRMDLGGHRFFSKSETVMDLWRKLMPPQGAPALDDRLLNRPVPLAPGGPDPEREDRVLLNRSRVSRIFYLRKFFDYPISLSLGTILSLGLFNTFRAGVGYLRSACCKRPEKNLEDFMINRFGVTLYRMFFQDYTEKVWGRAPKDIGADWGAQRIKGLSLHKAVADAVKRRLGRESGAVETSLIENFYYPKKGPGQLWELLRSEIQAMGGTFLFNTEAVAFSTEGSHITAVTAESQGVRRTIKADYVLSTMPVSQLVSALGDAVPDEAVKKIAMELPYRDFITVGLLVDQLKIKNTSGRKTLADLIPDCWIYVQERDVRLGRIQIFNNWSPYLVRNPEHTVWLGLEYFCTEGDELWQADDESFIRFAVGELEKIGMIDRADVLDSVRIRVPKAYPAYFGSYREFGRVRDFLDTVENLYCIGRNGQHRYNNMDHSMLTAIRAVEAITKGTVSKREIWEVNTEREYHEAKEGEAD